MRPARALLATLLLAAGLACSGGVEGAPASAPSPPAAGTAAASTLGPGGAGPSAAPAGARAEGEFWAVALEAPASLRAGEPAEARVRVAARGGYKVNEEYPMSFRPAADASPGFPGERVALAARDRTACGGGAGACEVTAPLPFVPAAAGEVRLAGTVAFSVCTAERCLIEKVSLAVSATAR
jgi:hypothetical protein